MGIGYIIKRAYYKKNSEAARLKIDSLPKIAVNPDCYSILEEPRLFKKRILELIQTAQKRICMTALYFQNDEAGQEIMDASDAMAQITNSCWGSAVMYWWIQVDTPPVTYG